MSENLTFLIEAGFNKDVSWVRAFYLLNNIILLREKALKVTNNNVQEAMEWLLNNQAELSGAATGTETSTEQNTLKLSKPAEIVQPALTEEEKTAAAEAAANSLKCDDCGLLLKDEDFATLHAHKTGHVNFSQSTECVKPKTKEEIEEQKKRLAEKLVKVAENKNSKFLTL